jgi:hypothetical protein
VIAGPDEAASRRFLEFLKGPEARAVFTKRGFGTGPVLSERKQRLARVEG